MNKKQLLLTGASLAFLSVLFGSFGAHAFEETLIKHGRVETYELAMRYQFFHALAFLFAGLWTTGKWKGGFLWLAGIILFSGSLVILSLTNSTAPYIVFATPLGGLTLIIGWASLIYSLASSR